MIELDTPIKEDILEKLKIGDMVGITGTIFTARDAAMAYLAGKDRKIFKKLLGGSILYHCGPIVIKDQNKWRFISAGPTTSSRLDMYQSHIFSHYGIRGAMGKGGMGQQTARGCRNVGAVYLHAVGGTGALSASAIKKVKNVYMLEEFGVPEAIWEIEVEQFPAVVTIDSKGHNLHEDILKTSLGVRDRLLKS